MCDGHVRTPIATQVMGGGWTATGCSRGAIDYDDDDVQTGRIGVRNETDCDGAVVVALLVSDARICVRVCARARARACGGVAGDGGGCARARTYNMWTRCGRMAYVKRRHVPPHHYNNNNIIIIIH